MYDVFISHASEDKARFVDAFEAALRERGLQVWYDSNEIRVGDDFRVKMDEGLSKSRFGVVVLSPSFFKYWPQAELKAGIDPWKTGNDPWEGRHRSRRRPVGGGRRLLAG